MKTTKDHDQRIANMTFAVAYPCYVTKVEKKGRTVEELHQVISWLTGFKAKDVQRLIKSCLLYTSPSPRDLSTSRMPSSA